MNRSNSDILKSIMDIGKNPKAQYGLGFRFSNPYDATGIVANAANAYLGTNLEARGFQYREDGTQRYDDNRVKLLSGLSAGMSALTGISNAYGQNMDNKREAERLRRIRDNEYYNVPTDRYAYNPQAQNSRQNVFYQTGGIAQESTFYQLPLLPQTVDTSLMLTGQRKSDYLSAVNSIEDERVKLAMSVGKANVAIGYGVDYMSKPVPTHTKFRYREKKHGGYEFQDGGQVEQTESPDFYEAPIEETFDSTTDGGADADPAFFLNGEPEEFDYSAYTPKLAHEHRVESPKEHGNLPIAPVLEKLKSMGLKPSSVNTGTHSVNSLHYRGRAVDLGINTTFGGSREKMTEFKRWFETNGERVFPGVKLSDETTRPGGTARGYTGSHYHLYID